MFGYLWKNPLLALPWKNPSETRDRKHFKCFAEKSLCAMQLRTHSTQ